MFNTLLTNVINIQATAQSETKTRFLVMAVLLAVFSIILIGLFSFYFYQFKKLQAKAKWNGWTFIGILSFSFLVCVSFWIAALVIALNKKEEDSNTALITLLAISFATLILIMIVLFLWIHKFGVAITEDYLLLFSEKIPLNKITKIIKDPSKKKIYINYVYSRRTYKRYRIRTSSPEGRFILLNVHLINSLVESGNETEYFKKLTSLSPEEALNKPIPHSTEEKDKSKK